jgi:hypothetical protein
MASDAMVKEVTDLITMESVMYVLLLTMPMDKEWVKMKAVRDIPCYLPPPPCIFSHPPYLAFPDPD